MKKLLLIMLLISGNVFAAETCKTLDTSTWTQDQKNQRQAIFYALAFGAGQDVVPRVEGDQICFESPNFNVNNLVTFTNFKNKLDSEESLRETARLAMVAKETERKTLKSQLSTDVLNFDTMNTSQKMEVVKKLIKIRTLEEDRT